MTVVCYYCGILFALCPLSVTIAGSFMLLKSWWEAGGTDGLFSKNKYGNFQPSEHASWIADMKYKIINVIFCTRSFSLELMESITVLIF